MQEHYEEYDECVDREDLDEELDEEYDEYPGAGSALPWWVRKAPALLVSVAVHLVIITICAYMTLMHVKVEEATFTTLIKREFKERELDTTLRSDVFNTERIIHEKMIERPIVQLEQEVVMTNDIPRGVSLDCNSNKNLDSRSCNDAYGIGGGAAGAYGTRFGKDSLWIHGGSDGTVAGVDRALRWLRLHQDKSDGKWDGDAFSKNCKGTNCDGPGAEHFDTGLTGLSLLAFLGHGQTHRGGKHKKVVRRALRYLKKQQRSDGQFGDRACESWFYNHAICTMAICEAYAITNDFTLKPLAQKAVKFGLDAQNPGKGWRYKPRGGQSDTSVTGWMVLALKAAKVGGLEVPDSAFKGARDWFDQMTLPSNGRCGYRRPGDRGASLMNAAKKFDKQETMTGVSIICRIFTGQKNTHKDIKKGVKLLMAKLPTYDKPEFLKVNHYYWYNATYAMFQIGGPNWKKWNAAMKKALLPTQCQTGMCDDGSWNPVGEWGTVGGRVYATAINALTLEIYYRYAKVIRKRN